MLLAALCASSAALAQPGANGGARTPPPQAGAKPGDRAAARASTADTKGAAPDAALIEYLGEFNDAADGLDAMGLSDEDAAAAQADKAAKGRDGG